MVSFAFWLLYLPATQPWYSLDRRLDGSQSVSSSSGQEINLSSLPGINPKFLGQTAHVPVATVLALYWFQSHMYTVQVFECTATDSQNELDLASHGGTGQSQII